MFHRQLQALACSGSNSFQRLEVPKGFFGSFPTSLSTKNVFGTTYDASLSYPDTGGRNLVRY